MMKTTTAGVAGSLPDDLFSTDTTHERTVELADGTKHRFLFRELPYVEFRKLMDGERSDKVLERARAAAHVIAASMVLETGEPALTVAQAAKLKPGVANAIFRTILELNGGVPAPQDEADDASEGGTPGN